MMVLLCFDYLMVDMVMFANNIMVVCADLIGVPVSFQSCQA